MLIRNESGGFSDEPNGGSPLPVGGQTGYGRERRLRRRQPPRHRRGPIRRTAECRVCIRQLAGFTQSATVTVGAQPRRSRLAQTLERRPARTDLAVANIRQRHGDRADRRSRPRLSRSRPRSRSGTGPNAVGAGDFNGDGRVESRRPPNTASATACNCCCATAPTRASTGRRRWGSGRPTQRRRGRLRRRRPRRRGRHRQRVGTVTVLDGGTVAGTPIPIGNVLGITAASFNGDARPDLAVTSDTAPGSRAYPCSTRPSRRSPHPPPPPPPPPTPTPTLPAPVDEPDRQRDAAVRGTVRVKEQRQQPLRHVASGQPDPRRIVESTPATAA